MNGASLKGNRIPGIPVHRIVGQIEFNHPQGWFGSLQAEHVDTFYVNNENTVENPAYTTAQLKMGLEKRWGPLQASLFMGVNNLFDEDYNANTRINAAGGRYFEPAPPFKVFAGISLTWSPFSQ